MTVMNRPASSSRRERKKIRPLATEKNHMTLGFGRMSRAEALLQVRRLLARSRDHVRAYQLISLFNIQAEELSEAGVPYEMLKVLERRCCL
jgi:hypothetical protein